MEKDSIERLLQLVWFLKSLNNMYPIEELDEEVMGGGEQTSTTTKPAATDNNLSSKPPEPRPSSTSSSSSRSTVIGRVEKPAIKIYGTLMVIDSLIFHIFWIGWETSCVYTMSPPDTNPCGNGWLLPGGEQRSDVHVHLAGPPHLLRLPLCRRLVLEVPPTKSCRSPTQFGSQCKQYLHFPLVLCARAGSPHRCTSTCPPPTRPSSTWLPAMAPLSCPGETLT